MSTVATRFMATLLLTHAFCVSAIAGNVTCKPEIRRNNIVANALFTTLFRSLNGELKSWSDVGESVFYGGAAGYLFYKGREMIGDGHENAGIFTTYLASSITENTTLNEHPLAYLRMGIGPLDIRAATPWATRHEPAVSIGVNAIDAFGLVTSMVSNKADDYRLRNGVVTATDRGIIEDDFDGYTVGRTVFIKEEAQDDLGLWRHELIHTTQYVQYSSFGAMGYNPFDFDKLKTQTTEQSSVGMHVRIEWFNAIVNQLDQNRDYQDRWSEIEAARLAQNTSPLHDPNDNNCSTQMGFQFQF